MSLTDRFKFKRKQPEEVESRPAETTAPESKDTPLRSVLRAKLIALAEQGDVAAIRTLLDRESLLSDEKRELTYEEAEQISERAFQRVGAEHREAALRQVRQKLDDVLEAARKRSGHAKPTPCSRFEAAIEGRLEAEGLKLALVAWQKTTPEQRGQLWEELRNGFLELGAEVVEHEGSGLVQ